MGQKQGHVLVIEGDWRVRKLIRANLESLGLEVDEATDGRHAITQVREQPTHLVLLEWDSLGIELSHLLMGLEAQAVGRYLPVVIMSAEPPDRALLKHRQVASYLQKPFAASALLNHVETALARSSTEGSDP